MYLLRFRKSNIFTLVDIMNDRMSFGSFSHYYNQNELQCIYDYNFLNNKYHDNSLTKENVTNVLLSKCFNRYFLSCFALSEPIIDSRYKHLWKVYANNDGLILVYNLKDVIQFSNSSGNIIFGQVKYSENRFDITDVLDKFLEASTGFNNEEIISRRFLFLVDKYKLNSKITEYLFQKTNYPYSFENEYRLIYLPFEEYKKYKKYNAISFPRPKKIVVLKTVDKVFKQIVRSICIIKNIYYEEVDLGSTANTIKE